MKIFIMRHGEAEQLAESDAKRKLTERGQIESHSVAKACSKKGFSQFDKVLVSPYTRAQQTWKQVSPELSCDNVEVCPDITPYGQPDLVFDYVCALIEQENLSSVLLISHLPLVGYLAAEFVPGMEPLMFPTSGLACIEFDPHGKDAELLWQLKA